MDILLYTLCYMLWYSSQFYLYGLLDGLYDKGPAVGLLKFIGWYDFLGAWVPKALPAPFVGTHP